MRAVHRWSLACLATALLLLTPYAGRLRPAPDPDVPTADLVTAVRDSAGTPYSGTVDVHGRVGLPIADHFSDLADLFGGRHAAPGLVARRPTTGASTGSSRPVRSTCSTRGRGPPSGTTSATRPGSPSTPRSGCRGTPTCCRPRWRAGPRRRTTATDIGSAAGATGRRGRRRRSARPDHRPGAAASATSTSGSIPRPGSPWPSRCTATRRSPPSARSSRRTRRTGRRRRDPLPPGARRRRVPDGVLDIADAANQFAPVRPPSSVAGLRASVRRRPRRSTAPALTRLLAVPLPPREADEIADSSAASGAAADGGLPLLRSVRSAPSSPRGTARGVRWLVAGTVTDADPARRGGRPGHGGHEDHDDPHPRAHQAVRRDPRGRRARPRRPRGRHLRLPRRQRLGQDDHGADAARPGARHRRASVELLGQPMPARGAGCCPQVGALVEGPAAYAAAVRAGQPRAVRRHGAGWRRAVDRARRGSTRRSTRSVSAASTAGRSGPTRSACGSGSAWPRR